ncbi:hypothetical protein NE237_009669 [Protea cynaroides]|uniref:Homeobox domain-containing protein n=1 Tax=Protea cynaroides TaxID=273540 RepID=A0A9Q0KYD4_9MAGN|nr:hypothetical protein NE237_009669 [Protea cynaroides]
MGGSCDTHSEEEKVLPEKNKKRRLKTPSQVEALENFYNEHKYPTESMKAQVAEELGLSEKQISGWFCHRRLKDKRLREEACANGRQDLSSGVIQDRVSGLRQDSCSSTKQGDNRHYDPMEVESRRLYGKDYAARDITYKNRDMRTGHYGTVDNTSSGSSSASQDRLLPYRGNPYDTEPSRYHARSSNYLLMDTRGIQNRGYMPASGCSNLQIEVEHAAITAVKRQLGRQYQENGPPVGVEFQLLPPGAFQTSISDPVHEPYYVGDPIQQDSQSIPRTSNKHGLNMKYDRYNSKMHAQGPYPKGGQLRRTMWESDPQPLKQKSSVSRRNHGIRSKHAVEGMRSDFATDHRLRLYSEKVITSESSYPHLRNYDYDSPHLVQRGEYFESKPSNLELLHNESLDNEDRGKFRRMDERVYGERRMSKEHGNQMGRRISHDEFLPRDNISKTPSPQALLPRTNQIKGSAVETPTSFSEDETEETSSSTG